MARLLSSEHLRKLARVLNSLTFRVGLLISLALLPIGLIAVFQTRLLGEEVQQRIETTLIGATLRLGREERATLQKALGTAEALSFVLPALSDNGGDCRDVLQEYVGTLGRYSFVGFVPADGIVTCSTADGPRDFNDSHIFKAVMADPRPAIMSTTTPTVSTTSVLVAVSPVMTNGSIAGYGAVSVPHIALGLNNDTPRGPPPVDVLTFNTNGDILTTRRAKSEALLQLPKDRALAALASESSYAFEALDMQGDLHIYAIVQVIPDAVYAISIWDPEAALLQESYFKVTAGAFPLLMWLVSMIVAFMALNRLVLRHVRTLRKQMNFFARSRELPNELQGADMPYELQEMNTDFRYMAEALLQDEARMEGSVREKNVLLKEIHHRVKNNLQLISSIMNMHRRRARSAETRTVLKRLQDRVLGLATVHRMLYQAEDLGELDAAGMLEAVFDQMLVIGLPPGSQIDIRKKISSAELFPDQAIPLSLLMSEALTNALKYVRAPEGQQAWIDVEFTRLDENMVELVIENTVDPARPVEKEDTDGSGLGTKLIASFATQLHADVSTEENSRTYRFAARFAMREFSLETVDY